MTPILVNVHAAMNNDWIWSPNMNISHDIDESLENAKLLQITRK